MKKTYKLTNKLIETDNSGYLRVRLKRIKEVKYIVTEGDKRLWVVSIMKYTHDAL